MARSSGKRTIGQKVHPDSKYGLGNEQEIAQRDSTGYAPAATSFSQIPPGGTGGSLNDAKHRTESGNLKFADPPV